MSARVLIVLPDPPSSNAYWTTAPGRGLVPTAEALEYKEKVAVLARRYIPAPLVGDVTWSGTWYRARKSGDLGNRLKVLEDALNGWAYLDDGQIAKYEPWQRSDADPTRPRVELILVGEAFASPREAEEHRRKKAAAAEKRRRTTNKNRTAKKLEKAGWGDLISATTYPPRRR